MRTAPAVPTAIWAEICFVTQSMRNVFVCPKRRTIRMARIVARLIAIPSRVPRVSIATMDFAPSFARSIHTIASKTFYGLKIINIFYIF